MLFVHGALVSIGAIPLEVCKLPALQVLLLHNNKLTGIYEGGTLLLVVFGVADLYLVVVLVRAVCCLLIGSGRRRAVVVGCVFDEH